MYTNSIDMQLLICCLNNKQYLQVQKKPPKNSGSFIYAQKKNSQRNACVDMFI